MTTFRRRVFLLLIASAAALFALPPFAHAQDYPARPITLIVPFPPGGPNDTLGRIMAERMRATLGQPVIVENVSGANGTIGVGRVARATPDGYTIGVGTWATHVVNPAIYALPYDTVKDFEPLVLLATSAPILVGSVGLPANNLKELIAWLKANPDKATMGTVGAGSPPHVARRRAPEPDRHALPLRALSRHRAGDAGHDGRADRSVDRLADPVAAAGARRQDQGLRRARQGSLSVGARHPDHG